MRNGVVVGLAVLLASVAAHADVKATFLPHWLPQAQFAGYYVAAERGFYRQRGLDLSIAAGGPDNPPSTALRDGKVDFALLWLSTAIQLRAQDVPLVDVAQIVQHSSLMLVAKKARGIEKLSDLNGRKVAVWGGDLLLQPKLLFQERGLDVHVVPIAGTINLFLRGGVDATVAMWYNEYDTIRNAGVDPDELTAFFFSKLGLDFPEDGIYCREATLHDDPERVAAFVDASLDGWQYAFAHPEEALDIVVGRMRRHHVAGSRVHQKWMLERMRDLILDGGSGRPSGRLTPARYERVGQALHEAGWIDSVPPFADFFAQRGAP
jgi:NitT/TauT family transport system substrate-binding protein